MILLYSGEKWCNLESAHEPKTKKIDTNKLDSIQHSLTYVYAYSHCHLNPPNGVAMDNIQLCKVLIVIAMVLQKWLVAVLVPQSLVLRSNWINFKFLRQVANICNAATVYSQSSASSLPSLSWESTMIILDSNIAIRAALDLEIVKHIWTRKGSYQPIHDTESRKHMLNHRHAERQFSSRAKEKILWG